MKLNIGSGHKELEDWDNIDKKRFSKKTILIDVEKEKLPYPDRSVEKILASHILEHLGDGLFHFLDECHRVLIPNGILYVKVPKFPTRDSVIDPTHKRFFIADTFDYFVNDQTCDMYGWRQWSITDKKETEREIIVLMTPNKEK